VVPEADDRAKLQSIIFDELCRGVIAPESRTALLAMIERGRAAGADGVIFGCTEIGLLLDQGELELPAVDTTIVHCEAAVEFALNGA